MQKSELKDFIGGWFIGNFSPSLYKTNDVEVAVKNYKAGDVEDSHFHKIATEYTLIIKGTVKMNGIVFNEGSIISIKPFEPTDFVAVTDATSVVVKIPGASNDKYKTNSNNL